MSEANLWKRVREGLMSVSGETTTGIRLSRVENLVEAGMPDVNGICEMREFWMELKHRDDFPVRGGPVFKNGGLREAQVEWISERVRCGSRTFVLAQVEKGLFLVHGIHCREFNEMSLNDLSDKARWMHYGPKPDWLELMRSVLSP